MVSWTEKFIVCGANTMCVAGCGALAGARRPSHWEETEQHKRRRSVTAAAAIHYAATCEVPVRFLAC